MRTLLARGRTARRTMRLAILLVLAHTLSPATVVRAACLEPQFALNRVVAQLSYPASLSSGDFNGDDRLDLAVVNILSPSGPGTTVSVLLGDGAGAFASPITSPSGVRQPLALAVADFDRDGTLDLAVVGVEDKVSILRGDGTGAFRPLTIVPISEPGLLVSADFDGDANPDLGISDFFGSAIRTLMGHGDGTFGAPRTFAVGKQPYYIGVGDLDNDHVLDLAVVNNYDVTVSILRGVGDGSFRPQTLVDVPGRNDLRGLTLADLNDDGDLDMVVINAYEHTIASFVGKGDGTFESPAVFTVGRQAHRINAADFNLDGRLDVAVANVDDGTISVLLGQGDGAFGQEHLLETIFGAADLVTEDLNRDGGLDIAVASGWRDSISVILNACVPSFPMPRFVISHARCRYQRPGGDSFAFSADYDLAEGSDGFDLDREAVAIRYGTTTLELPPGSFACMADACTFEGPGPGITRALLTEKSIAIAASGLDLSGTPNPVAVGVQIGNDRGEGSCRMEGVIAYAPTVLIDPSDVRR